MSGDPPPMSAAPYIIICSIRTQLAAAKDSVEKIVVVNHGAAQLCSFMQANYDAQSADFKDISDLQHSLMDGMATMSKDEVAAGCKEMIRLLYRLEKQFE